MRSFDSRGQAAGQPPFQPSTETERLDLEVQLATVWVMLDLEAEGLAKKLAVLGPRVPARPCQEAVWFGFPVANSVEARRFEMREHLRVEES